MAGLLSALDRILNKPIEEDPHTIPGFDKYSLRYMETIRYFKVELKKTGGAYILIAVIALFEGIYSWKDHNSLDILALLICFYVGITQTAIKFLFLRQFVSVNVNQPRRLIRADVVKILKSKLYKLNIHSSGQTIQMMFIIGLVMGIRMAISFGSSFSFRGWAPVLCCLISQIRFRMLLKSFDNTYENYQKFDLNPLGMKEAIYTKPKPPAEEQNGSSEGLAPAEEEDIEECSICCCEYAEGDQLLEFGCSFNHKFHNECLSKWLTQKRLCPMCRQHAPDHPAHSHEDDR